MQSTAHVAGEPVPDFLLGPLTDVADWCGARAQLPQQLAHDDYRLLRGAVERDQVQQARHDVLERLSCAVRAGRRHTVAAFPAQPYRGPGQALADMPTLLARHGIRSDQAKDRTSSRQCHRICRPCADTSQS